MKTAIRMEAVRAINNSSLILAVLVGLVLIGTAIVADFIRFVPYRHYLTGYVSREFVYVAWIFSVEIFVLFSPLFAVYPYSGSYLVERLTGYNVHVNMRMKRTVYMTAKAIANGVVGGIALTLPVLISFIALHAMSPAFFIPALPPDEWISGSGLVTVVVVCSMAFALGVAIATCALGLSLFLNNRHLALMLPLLLFLGYDFLLSMLNLSHSSLRLFLSFHFWGWYMESLSRVWVFFAQCSLFTALGAILLAIDMRIRKDLL